MTNANIGTVTESNFYDMRFLNPFEKLPNGAFYGSRYGYVQFIYIICSIISLIAVFFYSTDKNKLPLQIFFLIISYFLLYYNLSCLLIPNDHERCYLVVWICLLCLIMSTVLTVFGESLFKNINKSINKKTGGAHCKNDKDGDMNGGDGHKKYEEMNGAGGYGYKKDDDMYGAGGLKKYEEMNGGGGCKKKRKKGGSNCSREKEKFGGAHCYKTQEELEQTGGYFKY